MCRRIPARRSETRMWIEVRFHHRPEHQQRAGGGHEHRRSGVADVPGAAGAGGRPQCDRQGGCRPARRRRDLSHRSQVVGGREPYGHRQRRPRLPPPSQRPLRQGRRLRPPKPQTRNQPDNANRAHQESGALSSRRLAPPAPDAPSRLGPGATGGARGPRALGATGGAQAKCLLQRDQRKRFRRFACGM